MCEANDKKTPPSMTSSNNLTMVMEQNGQPPDHESSWPPPQQRSRCSLLFRGPAVTSGRELGVWKTSLEDQAGIVSRWMLSYLNPLLRLGAHKVLDADDIGVPSQQDHAERAYQVALTAWKKQAAKTEIINEKARAKHEALLAKCKTPAERAKVKPFEPKDPSIATALFTGYGKWTLLGAMFLYIVSALLGFVPVLILNDLVKYFESDQSADEYDFRFYNPWFEVALLGFLPFFISLLNTRHMTVMSHAAVFVRTAVSTMLYRKALRVSAAGRAKTSTGQVVNMMSNDTAQLQRFLQFGGMTLTAPIQIIISLVLIYQQVSTVVV